VRTDEIPHVVSLWPLLAALGISVMTWWLQGLIYAVLAQPQLKDLRVGDMFRIEMAGLFVALISPIRGAELPYKAFLMRRLGLSAPEGSNVVATRVLLDVAVLTPAALWGLVLTSRLPEAYGPNLLSAGLATAVILAAVLFLVRRKRGGDSKSRTLHPRKPGWWAKFCAFFADMHRSFASYWRRGHRATLVWALALTVAYWALRLCAGPLALMAVGWSGDWVPVVVAQLLLVSFVLPLAPTPGGSGARELGLGVLLSTHVPEGQLLSGLIVYSGLTHWLPVTVAAFFAGHELWRGAFRPRPRKAAGWEGRIPGGSRA
jgi:glycosyltransferase 2 family protein